MDYSKLATTESVESTIAALKNNGITAVVATDTEDAKKKVFELIPEGSEIMTMTSVTLDTLGITKIFNESGKYKSVRAQFPSMDASQKAKWGAGPDYTIGSVHSVTEDGKVVIASNTGSQLPAYAYGAQHVVWVVGMQKIVKNLDEALKRIYEYVLPQETVRARKAYNQPDTFHSNVSKILIVNKEVNNQRVHIVFVPEQIGF
jgi:L-lactate utilization protein LutB